MKKVISNEELYQKMSEAIDLLCNPVKNTLGPQGKNVILDGDYHTPFITNDGATIAELIESEDEILNAILTIAKEASIKTNDLVGDGTTTTLVLLQSIFQKGLKIIKEGYKPILLKKDLDLGLNKVIEKLNLLTKKPTKKDLKTVAKVAINDEYLGELVYKAYSCVKTKEAITIEEKDGNDCYFETIKGYLIDNGAVSPLFLEKNQLMNLNNCYLFITNHQIEKMEEIDKLISEIIDSQKSLLIVAEDYSEEVINELLLLNYQNILKVIPIKAPEFGIREKEILEDLALISNGKLIDKNKSNQLKEIDTSFLGQVNKVLITKETTLIDYDFIDEKKTIAYVKNIKNSLKDNKSAFELEFLNARYAKLTNGMVKISVGASTKTEMLEKKLRVIDGISSLEEASLHGILLGGGVSLLKIKEELDLQINKILLEALQEPFKQIMNNVGLNWEEIFQELKKNNFQKTYNVLTNEFEEVEKTCVIDAANVVKKALINAVSIAGMLLTTGSLVINHEVKKKIEIENEI